MTVTGRRIKTATGGQTGDDDVQDRPPQPTEARHPRTAVILPCLNEAQAIAGVIAGFRTALPEADIFVIDNASTDTTADVARAASATVLLEPVRGKGNAVRRAFAAIEADIYVIADGDGTYDAARAPELIGALANERLDMVVGARRKTAEEAYRAGHEFGNWAFNRALKAAFGSSFRDIFSGYRVLSRRFVKAFPAMSDGFEIETEMSVHAILLRMPTLEVDCDYGARPEGSASKLKTVRDGARILGTLFTLVRLHRPLVFFAVVSGGLMGIALGLFVPVFLTFLQTGLVPRFPTLIVSVMAALASLLALFCGLILDASARTQVEIRRLLFLNTTPADRHG